MGQSLRREPSRLEGVQAAGSLLPNRTPDPGRLDSLASKLLCSRRGARRLARDHASPLTTKTRYRADMGFESPTVVLADRIRWQKSTNVAWPKARTGEEPGQAVESSLLLQRAKRRKSVGSLVLVAKPTSGGGLAFEVSRRTPCASAEPSKHSSMEGALTSHDSESLTGSRRREVRRRAQSFGRDRVLSRRQRDCCIPAAWKTTPRARGDEPRVSRSDTHSGSVLSRIPGDSVKFGRHLQSVMRRNPEAHRASSNAP